MTTTWLIDKSAHARLDVTPDREEWASRIERAGLTVLHLDRDFDLIANITGQPVEALRVG